jgi:ATP-dependent DNA helicase RecG
LLKKSWRCEGRVVIDFFNNFDMLPRAESLTVEFKSDRKRLPDAELMEALVCLANTEGGELWLGVEDDGHATGLNAEHMALSGLVGMVAARTSPALQVTVEALQIDGVPVAKITVPKARGEVATQAGVYVRRRIKHDGTPECCWNLTTSPWTALWVLRSVRPMALECPR